MLQKFRLFVQRHDNGTYTVTVPGLPHVPSPADPWVEVTPATSRLAAHGPILEECKDDIRTALAKWLPRADPAELHLTQAHRENQHLEKVDVELRPSGRDGRKRHDKIRLTFSLLVTREEDGQYVVHVPKLAEPPLSFFCYSLDELQDAAARELAAYFRETPLEELMEYRYQRQELLDEIEVAFNPLKPQKERKKSGDEEETEFWALRASGINLTARAKESRLQRAFHREAQVAELMGILASERGSSLLLVGPSGSGKTAIMHEVVRRIREERCPPELQKRQVWYTTPDQLIAGCSFIGEWQEKLKNVVDEAKKRRHILFIDDVVGLMDAGRTNKADDNMAQFLKPFLADGTLVMVGETTTERYQAGEHRDAGFLRLFRTLRLDETDEATTLSVVGSVAAGLEHQLKVRIEPGAAEAAVELTRRFQPYLAFPGKAVSFVERVAADEARASVGERVVISRHRAVSAFAQHTGLPEMLLSDHLTLEPAALEQHFSERIIGQPDAVSAVADLVTVVKAGLNDPNKPLACLFFVGPTGVGKTEMAKALAEYLFGSQERILRSDMSEYGDPANVARLIGSPMGDAMGEMTRQIRLQPFSVVLLDEFEKAHSSVFDVMLQVLGEGRLTDAGGRTADFRSAIVIMTSNLGASPREQRRTGLRDDDGRDSGDAHFRRQVEDFFRPEFVNRIDRVVVFRPLDRDAMRGIAARELDHLLKREGIARRNLLVEIDDGVVDLLLEDGFSPVYGARPLKRAIERRLIVPLARYLVAHRIVSSHLIQVTREGDEIRLSSANLSTSREAVKRSEAPLEAGGSAKMDLADLVESFAGLRRHLHEWSEGDAVAQIRKEYTRLLAETRKRTFPGHGPEAHRTWSRIYHLERLTKRLDQLRERAEYLEEFATLSSRERSRTYQPDLAESFGQLSRDAAYLEIELLCAHVKENAQALLRVETLGKGARGSGEEWTVALARMYLHWAKRKGCEFALFVPTEAYRRWLQAQGLNIAAHIPGFKPGPPVEPAWIELKGKDFNDLLRRLEVVAPPEAALSARGPNVLGFLSGEAGAHKLILRDEEGGAAPFQTSVVRVEALEEGVAALEHLLSVEAGRDAGKAARKPDLPEVIRVYMPEGDRFVRDLRTDVRTTRVREVLEGDLDEFILAYLRAEQSREDA